MLENTQRTEISSLGEFGLIHHLTSDLEMVQSSTLYGVGDDAAVINPGDQKLLISTDLLVEGVHFDLTYSPLKHLGYKAATSNFSDMAAMNVLPTQITVSLALSNRFSVEAIDELYKGIKLACKNYQVDLVGGDTTTSKSGLMISVTVLGLAKEEDIVYRKGAAQGDLICVSGDLGAAYAGLLILEREKSEFIANPQMQPQLEGLDYLLERQLKPEARTDMVNVFKKLGVKPTSMMDISDGLASEIKHLCTQSQLGAQIYEEKIPIDQLTWDTARSFNMDPTMLTLNGGEDYELIFTLAQSDYDKIKDSPEIRIIGFMQEASAGIQLVTKNNVVVPIQAQGWDSFKSQSTE